MEEAREEYKRGPDSSRPHGRKGKVMQEGEAGGKESRELEKFRAGAGRRAEKSQKRCDIEKAGGLAMLRGITVLLDTVAFVQFGFGTRGDPGPHTCLVTTQVHSSAVSPAFRLLQPYSSSKLSHSV